MNVLAHAHIASITPKATGRQGIWKNLIENGFDANDRHTNGACIEDVRSTTCARNTKSATLSWQSAIKFNQLELWMNETHPYLLRTGKVLAFISTTSCMRNSTVTFI